MNRFTNISNTDLSRLIDEWVKGERDRKIMKRRLIDCICFEPLSEEFGLTADRVKQIIAQERQTLEKHLN